MTIDEAIHKFESFAFVLEAGSVSTAIAQETFEELRFSLKDVALNAPGIGGLALGAADAVAFVAFVENYTADRESMKSFFALHVPEAGVATNEEPPGEEVNVTAADVEAWVMRGYEIQGGGDGSMGKDVDGRDTDIDRTVHNMQYILLFGPDEGQSGAINPWLGSSKAEARAKYLPQIRQFIVNSLAPQQGDIQEPSEKLLAWGQVILQAWTSFASIRFPEIGLAKIKELLK